MIDDTLTDLREFYNNRVNKQLFKTFDLWYNTLKEFDNYKRDADECDDFE